MTTTNTAGRRLRKVMEVHGLSAAQVAAACDISDTTVRSIRGGARPSTSTARHLSRGLKALTGQEYSAAWLRGERVA